MKEKNLRLYPSRVGDYIFYIQERFSSLSHFLMWDSKYPTNEKTRPNNKTCEFINMSLFDRVHECNKYEQLSKESIKNECNEMNSIEKKRDLQISQIEKH